METKNEVRAAAPRILVIDRSKWLRGEDGNSSLRRTHDGKMCCLGFEALALGYTELDIAGVPDPESIDDDPSDTSWPYWLAVPRENDEGDLELKNTTECDELIRTNDNSELLASEREARIAAIFAKHGVEVRFVDGTEQPAAGPSEAVPLEAAIPDKEKGQ